MKRSWLFALFLTGTLAVLTAPASAKMDNGDSMDNSTQDSIDNLRDDLNSAMGSQSARLAAIEKQLGLKIFGDVRVRYNLRTQSQSNPSSATTRFAVGVPGTISDQAIGRYRARLGAKLASGDFSGGLRLATGSGNANSENNTFANGFQNPAMIIDLAYLTYTPTFTDGKLMLTVGKMGNPLMNTPMTWDPDIDPEGAALAYDFGGDTKARITYFDLANPAGTTQTVTDSGTGSDEYMVNLQLEHLFKLDATNSVNLMLGYEYIPNGTALVGGTNPSGFTNGYVNLPTLALKGSNGPIGSGNFVDYGGVVPDFAIGEGMLTIKHAKNAMDNNDFPLALTIHLINNFDSFNMPNGYFATAYNSSAAVTTAAQQNAALGSKNQGYSNFTNQYGFYIEASAGDTAKGDFLGKLAVSYVEPNAQLANLASDDANFTNTEYLFEQVGYGLEDNVVFLLSAWELQNVYNLYGPPNNLLTGNGNGAAAGQLRGNSTSPELQLYADCVLSL